MWVSAFVVREDAGLFFRHPNLNCWVLPGAPLKVESPVERLQDLLAGCSMAVVGLASIWEREGVTGATYVLRLREGEPGAVAEPWAGASPPLPSRPPLSDGAESPPDGDLEGTAPLGAGEEAAQPVEGAWVWLPLTGMEQAIERGLVGMGEGEWRGVQKALLRGGLLA